MRMDDNRIVKGMVLGWWEKLEEVERVKGARRKTMLFWRRILKEAGVDASRIGQLTSDRKKWKETVRKRMKRIQNWENSQGHQWKGEKVAERNATKEERMSFVHECEICKKICLSKGGLTIHRKRMHEISKLKKNFICDKCEREFSQEANLKNHRKVCLGGEEGTEVACDLCEKKYKRKGFKNHRRSCAAKRGIVELPTPTPPTPPARVYKRKTKPCPQCGIPMAATNIRRHIKEACKES